MSFPDLTSGTFTPPEETSEEEEAESDEGEEEEPGRHDSLLSSLLNKWGKDLDDLQEKVCADLEKTRETLGIPPSRPKHP